MRRLVMIVTCIALVGAGGAVLLSSAGATVTHKPALRIEPSLLKRLSPLPTLRLRPPLRRAPTLRAAPAPATCYVGAGSCSEHPCVEFVSPSSAVYQPVVPGIALASPRPSVRSQCRPAAGRLQRIGAAIATVRSAPVSVHQTAGVQLVK